jgi:ElaB/YqjD/DUF883 family membrane-anchored ribosome-binding protein
MGQTADELRQEIDAKRQDASQKIGQIEEKVTGTADQVREQVAQTFDWRHQVQERPLTAVSAAFIGGIVLSSVLSRDDDEPRADHRRGGSYKTVRYGERAFANKSGGVMDAVRNAARSSGLEDTINSMAGAMMSSVSDRMKQVAEQSFPGMADKLQNAASQGKAGDGSSSQSRQEQQPAAFQTGSAQTKSADLSRGGELGNSPTNA